MSKQNDYMQGRNDGLLLALKIVKEGGVEALEKEIRFRNITGIHTAMIKKELASASDHIKLRTLDTVLALSTAVLRDEFGFGEKRLERFINRFNFKTDCMLEGYVDWVDILADLEEDTGVKLSIRG